MMRVNKGGWQKGNQNGKKAIDLPQNNVVHRRLLKKTRKSIKCHSKLKRQIVMPIFKNYMIQFHICLFIKSYGCLICRCTLLHSRNIRQEILGLVTLYYRHSRNRLIKTCSPCVPILLFCSIYGHLNDFILCLVKS